MLRFEDLTMLRSEDLTMLRFEDLTMLRFEGLTMLRSTYDEYNQEKNSEGCAPIREDRYIVSYPDAIVTSEDSSPPISYLRDSYISFSCQVS